MSRTKTYTSWHGMKCRCGKSKGYEKISYCVEWEFFINFYRDMGERPQGKTLDRIDNNGNYCKDNCRWASLEKQANNRSNNKKYNYNGDFLTIPQIARKIGMSKNTLYDRLNRQKLSLEEALK